MTDKLKNISVTDLRPAMQELAFRDRNGQPCWCGRQQGHAGWLVCVEHRAAKSASNVSENSK